MTNDTCVFCKIINNQLPSTKVWEDDNFIAILNLFPNTTGVTLLITKQHLSSDIFSNEDTLLAKSIIAAKTVANKMKRGLNADRICIVGEGLEVEHFHLKLYPVYNLKKYLENNANKEPETEFSYDYKGYLSTKAGPMADRKELDRVGELIRRG